MKLKTLILAAIAAMPLTAALPNAATADDCRTYTKTIYIDGHRETAVGRACENRDGTWEIVKLSGGYGARERVREDIYDDLHDRGKRIIIVNNYGARYYEPTAYRSYHAYYPVPRYYDARRHYKHSHKHKHKKGHGDRHHHGRH